MLKERSHILYDSIYIKYPESKLVVVRGWVRRRMGSNYRTAFLSFLWGKENVPELDRADGLHNIMKGLNATELYVHFQMAKNIICFNLNFKNTTNLCKTI